MFDGGGQAWAEAAYRAHVKPALAQDNDRGETDSQPVLP